MRNIITVERHEVAEDTCAIGCIPFLHPLKLQLLIPGKVPFDSIVCTLDKHGVQSTSFEKIGHSWRIAKRINGPSC